MGRFKIHLEVKPPGLADGSGYMLLQGKRETKDDYQVFGPNNLGRWD